MTTLATLTILTTLTDLRGQNCDFRAVLHSCIVFYPIPCSLVTRCSHQVFGCGKDWFPISLLNFYFFFLSLLATDGLGLELKYSCSSFFKQFSTFQLAQGSPLL